MTINQKPPRALAALKLPRKIGDLINLATAIVKAMTGNPNFPNPLPTAVAMQTALSDLVAAEAATLTRAKGTVAVRNSKRQVLVTLLEEWRTFVQSTADASPETAAGIIESSGATMRKTPVRKSLGFHAKLGTGSGSVKVVAPAAAHRASYEWQYTVDGGKTWVDMPTSLQAKTTVTGLPTMTTVQFRYRATIKTGEGTWSQPISILVM